MEVNNVFGSKGGTGKSLVCATLGSYFKVKRRPCINIDVDPSNDTFSQFRGLDVRRVQIAENGGINLRLFDDAMMMIYGGEAERGQSKSVSKQAIIDSGSSAFIQLLNYMQTEGTLETLTALGHTLTIHCVIAGADMQEDSVRVFKMLAEAFPPPARFVIWLNPYSGPLRWGNKPFEASGLFQRYQERIIGTVQIPALNPFTYSYDLKRMLTLRKGFDEVPGDPVFFFITKYRLGQIQKCLNQQLDVIYQARSSGI